MMQPWEHDAYVGASTGRLLGGAGCWLSLAHSRAAERPPWYGQRVASEPGYVFSPGGWTAPPGVLPAWRLIDRYAHAWMWSHGGWEVRPPPGDNLPEVVER